jgi:hypothetical protein
VKLPPKAVLSRNFFVHLRTDDIGTETTVAEKALPEQEAPRKSRRLPSLQKVYRQTDQSESEAVVRQ